MTYRSKPADQLGSHRLPEACRRAAGVLGLILTVALGACGGAGDPPKLNLPPPERIDSFIDSRFLIRGINESDGKLVTLTDGQGLLALPLTASADFGESTFATLAEAGPTVNAEVFSDAPKVSGLGQTYWVNAETPDQGLLMGTDVELEQHRTLTVTEDSPTFRLIISAITLDFIDGNAAFPGCETLDTTASCLRVNRAQAFWGVRAWSLTDDASLVGVGGSMELVGWHKAWKHDAIYSDFVDGTHDLPIEAVAESLPVFSSNEDRHVRVRLSKPIVIDLPISHLKPGDRFFVRTLSNAVARAGMGGEFFMGSFFRDPTSGDGITIESSGVELVQAIAAVPPPIPPAPPCSGPPEPAAGQLQFSTPSQGMVEGTLDYVRVVRTGGTKGLVSVRLASADGSAVAGEHYEPVDTIVRFGDGQAGPAIIPVQLLDDAVREAQRSFTLTLSEPSGCAVLGAPAANTVARFENDLASQTFTVGGSVTGLVGSGLTLRDAAAFDDLPILGNGPFTFPASRLTGMTYDVQVATQPANPIQSCRVAQGSGTVTNANVANVAVTCDPPAAPPGNGALDPAFGSGGRAIVSGHGFALAAALQADGKMVLLTDFQRLLRLLPNGTLDPAFGTGGVVNATLSGGGLDQLRALALQADGGILVAGLARGGTGDDAGVRRYLADGTPDTAFGSGGLARVDFNGLADDGRALVVQPDGRIVLAAQALVSASSSDFGIARLDANGALDAAFGTGGRTTVHLAGFDQPAAVSLQADGRIVVAGRTANGGGSTPDTGVLRLLPDGQHDTTFGSGGATRIALTADWDEAKAVVALPDGRVLLALEARSSPSAQFQQALARLKADGTPDETFGNLGVALHGFSAGGDRSRALLVLADGRIVVGGFARAVPSSSTGGDDMLISRHAADGSLDTSFGSGGRSTFDSFGSTDSVQALALRPDGRVLAAGAAFNSGTAGAGVLQLLP